MQGLFHCLIAWLHMVCMVVCLLPVSALPAEAGNVSNRGSLVIPSHSFNRQGLFDPPDLLVLLSKISKDLRPCQMM